MRKNTADICPVASMRGPLVAIMTFATLALFASEAWAKTFPIGRVSQGSLAQSCNAAGGVSIGFNAGGYGCVKHNCDGKGNDCAVTCHKEGCYGHTPIVSAKGKTVSGVLDKQPGAKVTLNPQTLQDRKVGQLRPIDSRFVQTAQTFQPKSQKTPQPQSFSGADRGPRSEGRGSKR